MSGVISDTGPLNYLLLIGKVDLLEGLFEEIIVPRSVLRELQDHRAPEVVRTWALEPPAWVRVREASEWISLEKPLCR